MPESMIRSSVLLKLEMVGLRGTRDLMPYELSGGMARRVALARAVALDPELILYDEPFAVRILSPWGVIARLVRTLNDTLGLTPSLFRMMFRKHWQLQITFTSFRGAG